MVAHLAGGHHAFRVTPTKSCLVPATPAYELSGDYEPQDFLICSRPYLIQNRQGRQGKGSNNSSFPGLTPSPRYLAHKCAGLNNGEIGKYFGGIHSSNVSQGARRIGEKMVSDKGLTEITQELESLLRV
jgi:hypothetical protein